MQLMIKNNFIALILLFIISSCNKNFDTQEEMMDYIKDERNGYSQTKTINGITVNITYKPTELMVYQESVNKNYSKAKKNLLKMKYDKCIYFIVSYSKNDKEILSTISNSREQFNSVQNTLSFQMDEKMSLVNNKSDTIPLIGFNFPRTYGMARSTNLLFVFERNSTVKESSKFYFNITDIGVGIGDITFKYDSNIINKTTF